MKLEQPNPLYRFHPQLVPTWNWWFMASNTNIITRSSEASSWNHTFCHNIRVILVESHVFSQHSCHSIALCECSDYPWHEHDPEFRVYLWPVPGIFWCACSDVQNETGLMEQWHFQHVQTCPTQWRNVWHWMKMDSNSQTIGNWILSQSHQCHCWCKQDFPKSQKGHSNNHVKNKMRLAMQWTGLAT